VNARTPIPLELLRRKVATRELLQAATLYSYAAMRSGGDPDVLAEIAWEVQERHGPEGLFALLVKLGHTGSIFAEGYADLAGVDLGELLDSFELNELNGLAPGGGAT
jgi:hypothetical protein